MGCFGVAGPIDEFVEAMHRLTNYMKQQNSKETQARGMRELQAINGDKGDEPRDRVRLPISFNCVIHIMRVKI